MRKYQSGSDPKANPGGGGRVPKEAPKGRLDLQNPAEDPEPSDGRLSLARLLQASALIDTQIQDLSSLFQEAKLGVSRLEQTLQVLHRENANLRRNVQALQHGPPAPLPREEGPGHQAGKQAAAPTPAAQPGPDRASPVVIDMEEKQQGPEEALRPHCLQSALRSWTARSLKGLPGKIQRYLDMAAGHRCALPYQAEDELAEVVVLP